MPTRKRAPKRATVYFDPGLHKALRVKAAETERSLSELVNAAVRQSAMDFRKDGSYSS
jgi:predicted HicB family RNase H-like nuclease